MCKALINDKLSEDFYQRISAIILLFAPLMIIGLNKVKPNLFNVVINTSESTNISPQPLENKVEKDPKTNIILGFISSYYKKLNKWIRRLLIFIIVILFYINGGFRFLSEEVIFLALNYKLEIKYLLQLSLILPIVLSIIALYILMDVRIKGEITISPKAEGEEKIS